MPLQEVLSNHDRALQDIADLIVKSRKQIVITGAGISTSCGIPDFRSKDGLYNLIPERVISPPTPPPSNPSTPSHKRKACTLDNDEEVPSSQSSVFSSSSYQSSPSSRMRGQDLFNARVLHNVESMTIFYRFITALRLKVMNEVKDTSATHKFIRALRDGGRLVRCYTQNIDGLEAREGLCVDLTRGKGNKRRFMKKHYGSPRPQDTQSTDFDGGCEVVQLHGELTSVRCRLCADVTVWTEAVTNTFLSGSAPTCEPCQTKSAIRVATGKRELAIGELRPNIVLYGEDHPQNAMLAPLILADAASQPDILIIMGTSLKVHGLQKVVKDFAKAVHARKNGRVIFVNRTKPSESIWEGVIDDYVAMDCDDWVADLRSRRDDIWLRQGEISLKVSKATSQKRKKSEDASTQDIKNVPPKKKAKLDVKAPCRKKVKSTLGTLKERHQTQGQSDKPHHKSSEHDDRAVIGTTRVQQPLQPTTPSIDRFRTPHQRHARPGLSEMSPARPPVSPLTPAYSLISSPGRTNISPATTPTPRTNAKSALRQSVSIVEDDVHESINAEEDSTTLDEEESQNLENSRRRLDFISEEFDRKDLQSIDMGPSQWLKRIFSGRIINR